MTAITWNPSDKDAHQALSGGNLIATSSAGSGTVNSAVRATQAVSVAVKTYFEITFSSSASAQYFSVGVMNSAAALNANIGATNGINFCNKFNGSTSAIYLNGSGSGTYPALTNGQVLRVAVDRANNKIWFAINANTWSGSAVWMGSGGTTDDPGTGVGGANIASVTGTIFPAISSAWTGDVATLNGGTAGFAYAIPTGFTQLDTPPVTNAQVTQVGLEEWSKANPLAQVTQVALEEWGTVALAVAGVGEADAAAVVTGAGATVTLAVSGVGEADAAAAAAGAGAAIPVAAGRGEADAAAAVTGAGAATIPGVGRVDAAAVVTGAGAAIPTVTGVGEADAAAIVTGAGFAGAIGAGEVDAFADVRGMGAIIAPPNSLPFLPGLGWSVHRRPTFDTIVAPHSSGAEVRLALWQNALWEFELSYDALASNAAYPGVWTNTLQTLMGFYLARGGARGTFLFIDPDFNSMTGQGIGAGDGTTVAFSFVRTFGGQVEPVGWVTNVAAVYLAGAPVTTGWTVSGNTITFASPPANGVVVSADFSYGFVCRFLEDTIDFEEFMDNLWQLKSLKFRQVRL